MTHSPWTLTNTAKELLTRIAWRRSEQAFITQILSAETNFADYPDVIFHIYTASLVISGQSDNRVFDKFNTAYNEFDLQKHDPIIFWYARSLVDYARSNIEAASEAVDKCKAAILEYCDFIPDEDSALLTAIAAGQPLPKLVH